MKPVVAIILFAILSSGCMSTSIKQEAFGKNKRYAIVSLTGSFHIDDAHQNRTFQQLIGTIVVSIYQARRNGDTMVMLDKTQEILDEEFSKAKSLNYVSSKEILDSQSYRYAQGVEPNLGYALAPNYIYFNEKNQDEIQRIILDNKLDGVIFVSIVYTKTRQWGGYSGTAMLTIRATDNHGNEVWKQKITAYSKDVLDTFKNIEDLEKFYPLLEDATQRAIYKGIQTLDDVILSGSYGTPM